METELLLRNNGALEVDDFKCFKDPPLVTEADVLRQRTEYWYQVVA